MKQKRHRELVLKTTFRQFEWFLCNEMKQKLYREPLYSK
jgi:hypothetical protein